MGEKAGGHQSHHSRGKPEEGSPSAEGKTKFLGDRREQSRRTPEAPCEPRGSGRGTRGGWQALQGRLPATSVLTGPTGGVVDAAGQA